MTGSIDVQVTTNSRVVLPEVIFAALSAERRTLWDIERALWAPRTLIARNASGDAIGAALTAGRPYTAYRKIVDVIVGVNAGNEGTGEKNTGGKSTGEKNTGEKSTERETNAEAEADTADAVFAALVAAAQADVPEVSEQRPSPIVVHFEEHLAVAPLTDARRGLLESLGFAPAPRPVPSIPSTRAGDAAEVAAWSWWRGASPKSLAPYYGQTTEVSCGAVASLMALEQRGADAFDADSLVNNRALEIAVWRRATNLPACEPIGLAVEAAQSGTQSNLLSSLPRVILSATGPVLVEEYSSDAAELALRTDLQLESLRQAEALGIPIERRWIDVGEIAGLVRDGAQVLLLIDLTELIADPTPHWVLATDVIDDALIVSDPWVQYPNGETWVDAFALPIPLLGIDLITRWGDPAYRGVIVLPSPEAEAG